MWVSGAQGEEGGGGDTYLLVDQLTQLWITVAECVHGDPGSKIDIPPILQIPQVTAAAFRKHGQRPGICSDHVLFVVGNHACRARIWCRIGIGQLGFPLGDWGWSARAVE